MVVVAANDVRFHSKSAFYVCKLFLYVFRISAYLYTYALHRALSGAGIFLGDLCSIPFLKIYLFLIIQPTSWLIDLAQRDCATKQSFQYK